MPQDGEIAFPPGTRHVTVQDVARLIALALYPEHPGEMSVDYIKKTEATEAGLSNRTVELAPEEWKYLNKIWRLLPPFQSGIPESAWRPYAAAFDAVAAKLSWRIVPFTKTGPLGAAILRASAEERHSKNLQKAILEGRLTTYDHARVPNPPAQGGFPDARLRMNDFTKYVEQFDLRVRVLPVQSITDAKWVMGDIIKNEVVESYTFHDYAAKTETERTSITARIERQLTDDVLELLRVSAITPIDPTTGSLVDPKAAVSPDWHITREDLEAFLHFVRSTSEGKRDFLLDFERRQGEGRYTLKAAAKALAANTHERYEALLSGLVSAAENEVLPTYAPGMYQQLRYGSRPGEATVVREFYEEVYWRDLNIWLEKHEPRISFRFPSPAGDAGMAQDVALGLPNVPKSGQDAVRKRPPSQQQFQESEILRVLGELEYIPKALPKPSPGVDGPKAAVRAKLNFTSKVFDKAWERLRADGKIEDSE